MPLTAASLFLSIVWLATIECTRSNQRDIVGALIFMAGTVVRIAENLAK